MMRAKMKNPVIKEVLPQGITMLVHENHSVPTVSLSACFPGGISLEHPGNNGITSLLQRVITRGTGDKTAKQLAEEMEYYGLVISPFLGRDLVGLNMKTLSRHWDRGLDIYSSMLMHPSFPQEEIEKERKIQLQRIKNKKDDILSYCIEKCHEMIFEGHSYRLPEEGEEEPVESITREDIIQYHKTLYSPVRMFLSVAGDVRTEDVIRKLTETFSSFQSHIPLPETPEVNNPIRNVREYQETSDKLQCAIAVGFQAPDVNSEDYFTFLVLNQSLSGMGSRLFVELRDKQGLAYSVNSLYSGYKRGGAFKVYILTSAHQKERARAGLLEEVDRLRTRLVSYDELVRAKRFHLGLFEIGLQSNLSRASRLAYFELMGIGHKVIEEYGERIKRITRQKVKRAAERYLKPQSYAISVMIPAKAQNK